MPALSGPTPHRPWHLPSELRESSEINHQGPLLRNTLLNVNDDLYSALSLNTTNILAKLDSNFIHKRLFQHTENKLYSYTITSQLRSKTKAKGVSLSFTPEVNRLSVGILIVRLKTSPPNTTSSHSVQHHLLTRMWWKTTWSSRHLSHTAQPSPPNSSEAATFHLPFPTALGGTQSWGHSGYRQSAPRRGCMEHQSPSRLLSKINLPRGNHTRESPLCNRRPTWGFCFARHTRMDATALYHKGHKCAVSWLCPRAIIYRKHPHLTLQVAISVGSLHFYDTVWAADSNTLPEGPQGGRPKCLKFLKNKTNQACKVRAYDTVFISTCFPQTALLCLNSWHHRAVGFLQGPPPPTVLKTLSLATAPPDS